LLMDEAFSALDPLIRSDMQAQLLDLQSKLHKTIVFITHDLDESLKLGDHIGILNGGKLVQVGRPEEIIMNPADDYVTAFVKDVNRAKVLRAKTIMLSPEKYPVNGKTSGETIKVREDRFIEEFLPQVLEKRVVVEVIDNNGNTSGFITEKELAQSLTKI
ncbi:MAG: glycine/betaine ABC transporter ATP-binding protein, partial [SAR324 cluster bacterium]|nr:glycine/betaine ABC transporter ATP-binding protein [SAR324 cluster bacterium]